MSTPNQTGDLFDVSAWHNHQPGATPTLFVTGKVTFPTGGYRVELRPVRGADAGTQDGQKRKLQLEKVVYPPEGPATQAFQTLDVRYEEVTDVEYAEVRIHPDGVTAEVQEVY